MGLKPYVIQVAGILQEHVVLRDKIAACLATRNDLFGDEDINCHQVCERLLTIPEFASQLEHTRGWFLNKGYDHSWLRVKSHRDVIIDPYPWAVASGPILVCVELGSPWFGVYLPQRAEGALTELESVG